MSATVFYNSSAELATCSNVFEVTGTPTDPTAVTLTITDPAGTVTAYNWPGGPNTLTRTGTGAFTQDVPCASLVDGIWTGLWAGTGTASDAAAFTWTTWTAALNRYYCSDEELKSRLGITDTADDFEITFAKAVSSRAIDLVCGRHFYQVTETRTYVPRSLYQTRTDDIASVTALATDPGGTAAQGATFPVSWPAGSFQLLPVNPGRHGEPWPYTRIKAVGGLTFPWIAPVVLARLDRVQVTGPFGWPAIPLGVHMAALISAADFFRLKDAPFGIAGVGEFAVRIQANPRVMSLLEPYVSYVTGRPVAV